MENYPLTVAGIQEMVSDIMKAREADIKSQSLRADMSGRAVTATAPTLVFGNNEESHLITFEM